MVAPLRQQLPSTERPPEVDRSYKPAIRVYVNRVPLGHQPLRVQPYNNVWDVTGDGKRFLFGETVNEGSQAINVVLNWAVGLKH